MSEIHLAAMEAKKCHICREDFIEGDYSVISTMVVDNLFGRAVIQIVYHPVCELNQLLELVTNNPPISSAIRHTIQERCVAITNALLQTDTKSKPS